MAAARVNAGMTQEEVAHAMGVSNKTIVNWETGKIRPRAAQLRFFCEVVDYPLDGIFMPEDKT